MPTTSNPAAQRRLRPAMPAPWSIYLWRVVFRPAAQARQPLLHLGTRVTQNRSPAGRPAGQTMWADSSRKHRAGLLWDWVELDDGVVAMLDPMAIVTNIRFVNTEGEVLASAESALHLIRYVHALAWQARVREVLRPV